MARSLTSLSSGVLCETFEKEPPFAAASDLSGAPAGCWLFFDLCRSKGVVAGVIVVAQRLAKQRTRVESAATARTLLYACILFCVRLTRIAPSRVRVPKEFSASFLTFRAGRRATGF
ncbi:hypothetical protein BIW11_06652 [Tropilaelaps mercedesae]|uniref:Uncharacterized protein n=1 Tax=Tropilaelaps mercedesae TaxID=418985 RepID=A0A1V9XX80_9ACAR|nr:hypothetical protein BIW11_06652 [Tropilaelaps mercedesae]